MDRVGRGHGIFVVACPVVQGPYDLEDVMLTNETFIPSIKQLIHHLVHIGQSMDLAVDRHVLQTEEAITDQLKVSVILNVMHGLVTRL